MKGKHIHLLLFAFFALFISSAHSDDGSADSTTVTVTVLLGSDGKGTATWSADGSPPTGVCPADTGVAIGGGDSSSSESSDDSNDVSGEVVSGSSGSGIDSGSSAGNTTGSGLGSNSSSEDSGTQDTTGNVTDLSRHKGSGTNFVGNNLYYAAGLPPDVRTDFLK